MYLKSLAALCLLAATPAFAQTPTAADAQKIVDIIRADPAKQQTYCELGKVDKEMEAAYGKNDTKTLETLNAKAEGLAGKLGPEYGNFIKNLGPMDENSADGKAIAAALDSLDKQCK